MFPATRNQVTKTGCIPHKKTITERRERERERERERDREREREIKDIRGGR